MSALAALALALAGCGVADVAQPAASPTIIRASPSPTPSQAGSAWIVSPIGVNLRAAPDPSAQRLGTLGWSVQLDVLDSSNGWLRVKAHDGTTAGWVLADPLLVTTTPVKPVDDIPDGFSLLIPTGWTATPGSPARFGSGTNVLATIYTAGKTEQLPALPLKSGAQDRQGGPVELYGKTAFYTVYRSQGGGYEIAVQAQLTDSRAMLVDIADMSGNAASPDLPLFNLLVASVVVR